MGTRGINVVVLNGEIKVAQYNQFDSYPTGQGVTALTFVRDKMNKEEFKKKVLISTWITEEEHKQYWANCGADPTEEWVNMEVSEKFKEQYLYLHRDCGADIYQLIQDSENGLKLKDDTHFASDSLFCEWGYLIDLDKNTFEVYKGFNKLPLHKSERFSHLKNSKEYCPIKLVKSYSLDNLPTNEDFINDFKSKDDE